MNKRVVVIAALVSGALAVSGCTTNPYTGEREAGKSGIGAGLGSLVGAVLLIYFFPGIITWLPQHMAG